MEKPKSIIGRVVLIVILYSILTHWSDIKSGFIDGLNNSHTTAMNTRLVK
jgi:hypothetical protein